VLGRVVPVDPLPEFRGLVERPELLRLSSVNLRFAAFDERDRNVLELDEDGRCTVVRGATRPWLGLDVRCLMPTDRLLGALDFWLLEFCWNNWTLNWERLLDFFGLSAAMPVPLTGPAASNAVQIAELMVLQNIAGAP